jgi:hypothetical protein
VWICLLCVYLFLFKPNSKIAKLEEELLLVNNSLKTLEHNEEKVKFVLKKNLSLLNLEMKSHQKFIVILRPKLLN